MGATKRFRDQHDDLLMMASEISLHLKAEYLSRDANEARLLLSKLLGKLSIHLAMEDKALYPQMLEHSDDRVRSMARKFMDEMGGLGEAVNAYKAKWPSALPIQDDPDEFISQTKGIFDALANRIERENNELYEMVDDL